jgi:regulatory protein
MRRLKRQMPDSVSRKKQSPSLKARALRLLSQREHSRAELAKKLHDYAALAAKIEREQGAQEEKDGGGSTSGAPLGREAQIDAVLDDFEARGWLSDARYAEALVRRRSERYGMRRIKDELQRAGVAPEASSALLAELKNTEFQRAKELFERKFTALAEDQKARAKQYRFLVSKGFNPEIVARVIGGRQGSAE